MKDLVHSYDKKNETNEYMTVTDIVACRVLHSCCQVSKTIITVHPIADWAGIICRLRSVDVSRMLKEEGLGGWSIGKLGAGINYAKL